jgi:hypothetical protein
MSTIVLKSGEAELLATTSVKNMTWSNIKVYECTPGNQMEDVPIPHASHKSDATRNSS